VKVKAFGLNRMDLLQREGKYPVPPQAPKTLGVEFSGVITELGDSADKNFSVGDEVFGLAYGGEKASKLDENGLENKSSFDRVICICTGAYAEYIAVASDMLVTKPKEMSWEQAAAIPEVRITSSFFV
jgi:NADPH:quinone reductase-like Zn-dependent oxidoreductase